MTDPEGRCLWRACSNWAKPGMNLCIEHLAQVEESESKINGAIQRAVEAVGYGLVASGLFEIVKMIAKDLNYSSYTVGPEPTRREIAASLQAEKPWAAAILTKLLDEPEQGIPAFVKFYRSFAAMNGVDFEQHLEKTIRNAQGT